MFYENLSHQCNICDKCYGIFIKRNIKIDRNNKIVSIINKQITYNRKEKLYKILWAFHNYHK